MAEPVNSRITRTLPYIAIGIGLLVLALCCALPILLGSMGIDVHLTQSYFVVAHVHWLNALGLLCLIMGIAGVTVLARTLYTRFIGS
jgi:heme/copper-type cytochrome/quinol oxidase subunit 1